MEIGSRFANKVQTELILHIHSQVSVTHHIEVVDHTA
jgi:hypothetical protein